MWKDMYEKANISCRNRSLKCFYIKAALIYMYKRSAPFQCCNFKHQCFFFCSQSTSLPAWDRRIKWSSVVLPVPVCAWIEEQTQRRDEFKVEHWLEGQPSETLLNRKDACAFSIASWKISWSQLTRGCLKKFLRQKASVKTLESEYCSPAPGQEKHVKVVMGPRFSGCDARMRRRSKLLSGDVYRACSGENQLLTKRVTVASQQV